MLIYVHFKKPIYVHKYFYVFMIYELQFRMEVRIFFTLNTTHCYLCNVHMYVNVFEIEKN